MYAVMCASPLVNSVRLLYEKTAHVLVVSGQYMISV